MLVSKTDVFDAFRKVRTDPVEAHNFLLDPKVIGTVIGYATGAEHAHCNMHTE